jgi:hypothetical protein
LGTALARDAATKMLARTIAGTVAARIKELLAMNFISQPL